MKLNEKKEIQRQQIEKLAELFNSQYPEAHKIAAWAISVIGEPAVPYLLKAIPSRRDNTAIQNGVLNEIEWAIKSVGQPAIPHLLEALDGDNSIAAELATKALRDLDYSDTLHLSKSLTLDAFTNRINEILAKDTAYKKSELGDYCQQQLEKIRSLGEIGDSQAISILIELIQMFRDNPIFNQSALINRGDSSIKTTFIKQSITALEQIGDPAIGPILEFINSDQFTKPKLDARGREQPRNINRFVKTNIIQLFGNNASTTAIEALIGMLGNETEDYNLSRIINIIRTGSNPEPTLIDLLNHESKQVQQLAVDALSWVKKNQ